MKEQQEKIKKAFRGIFWEIAKLVELISQGRVTPWHISWLSITGHLVVMAAISQGMWLQAAISLAVFGLLDTLDGSLAKLQGSASTAGMLLDSTGDRFKEALVYAGFAYYFAETAQPIFAMYSVLLLGLSASVSYIKAKGEVALLTSHKDKKKKGDVNRQLEYGIFEYNIRMGVIFFGLLLMIPKIAIIALLVGVTFTLVTRYTAITRLLSSVSDDKS